MSRKMLRSRSLSASIVLMLGFSFGAGPAAAAPSAGEVPATQALEKVSEWLGALQAWWGELAGSGATAAKLGSGTTESATGSCNIKQDSEAGDTTGCRLDPDGGS